MIPALSSLPPTKKSTRLGAASCSPTSSTVVTRSDSTEPACPLMVKLGGGRRSFRLSCAAVAALIML